MKKGLFKRPRSRTPKENKFPTGQASSLRDRQESKRNPQPVSRFWGLAKRLEHRRTKGKQNN